MTPDFRRTRAKVIRRLVPLLCVLYILNILDRGNAGFARITMQDDLGITPVAFDLAFGLFYIGYLLFEVPSNLIMHRLGARRWISRILVTWGLVSCATMYVTGFYSFAAVRVLLGFAEAGFFPGIVLYLTYWFPAKDRARVMAYFMIGNALGAAGGNPLSGWIMTTFNGVAGLAGWQWLFLLEGLPSVAFGFVAFYCLPDRPADASWLRDDERQWLTSRLDREEGDTKKKHGADALGAMLDGRVWLLICIYFTVAVGSNASAAYLPTLVKESYADLTPMQVGWLSALPHACAAVVMTLFGLSSDRFGERRWHLAAAATLGSAGWMLALTSPTPLGAMIGLCVAQAGMMSMLPIFWTLPTVFLTGVAAAGGIALINSVANIGGFVGPSILGASRAAGLGYWPIAALLLAGAALSLCVGAEKKEADHA